MYVGTEVRTPNTPLLQI